MPGSAPLTPLPNLLGQVTHLELDQHALAAHTTRAPQVVDVLVLLVELPSAHRLLTGTIIT